MPPDQFARQLTGSGQLGAVVADVLRSKAADLLAERVKVTDESGRKVTIGGAADEESGEDEPAAGEADAEAADASAEAAPAKGRSRRSAKSSAGKDDDAKPKSRSRRGRKDADQGDEVPEAAESE